MILDVDPDDDDVVYYYPELCSPRYQEKRSRKKDCFGRA